MKPRQNPASAAEINLDSGGTKRGDARARKVARLAREILHAHSVAILEMKELPASLRRAMRRGPASVDRLKTSAPGLRATLGTDYALLVPMPGHTGAARLVACGYRSPVRIPATRAVARGRTHRNGLEACRRYPGHSPATCRETARTGAGDTALGANTLADVLKHLCGRAVTLFHASSVSVWLHDRRAGLLQRAGSAIPATDLRSPAARGLRRPPDVSRSGRRRVLTAPLRGSRRALGTLVIEGIDLDRIPRALALDHARELVAFLGPRIESASLLDDVQRARRELENAFNSMTDLVIVCDRQLNMIRANQAFSDRFRLSSEEIAGRPLSSVIGIKTIRWLASIAEPRSARRGRQPRETTDQIGGTTFSITATPLVTPDRGPDGIVLAHMT